MRHALRDTEVAGIVILAGSPVSCIFASADSDPDRWDDPDTFNFHRPPKSHRAFGQGAHFCVGKRFAKAQIAIVLRLLLAAHPALTFAEGPPAFQGWEFLAPVHLKIAL